MVLSLILAFTRKEFILIGDLAFGGRTSVMVLVLIEIADAFIDGETWGITHHTWFTPSNSETSNKIDSSIKKALRKIKSKTPPNPETK